jgi:hypothetical protein
MKSATSLINHDSQSLIANTHDDHIRPPTLVEEETYLGDNQYAQYRFTDTYSEYFEDDGNKADRFIDNYYENFTFCFNRTVGCCI